MKCLSYGQAVRMIYSDTIPIGWHSNFWLNSDPDWAPQSGYRNLLGVKQFKFLKPIEGSVQGDEWGVGHMHVQFLLVQDSRDRD